MVCDLSSVSLEVGIILVIIAILLNASALFYWFSSTVAGVASLGVRTTLSKNRTIAVTSKQGHARKGLLAGSV